MKKIIFWIEEKEKMLPAKVEGIVFDVWVHRANTLYRMNA